MSIDIETLESYLRNNSAYELLPQFAAEGCEGICRLLIEDEIEHEYSKNRVGLLDDALLKAVENDYFNLVKSLLERGSNPHANNSATILLAAKLGRLSMLQIFFDYSNVNFKPIDDLLLTAFKGDHPESTIKFLLRKSPGRWESSLDIHANDDELLFYAIEKRNAVIVSLLLDCGANLKPKWGDTPWELAKRKDAPEIINILNEALHEREQGVKNVRSHP